MKNRTIGVLMGGMLTMIPIFSTYVAYVLPLALPPVLWLLLQDHPLRSTIDDDGLAGEQRTD